MENVLVRIMDNVKFRILTAVIFLCYSTAAKCQVIRLGRCPNIPVKSDFKMEPYFGLWYEQQRYFAAFELGLSCVTAEYSLLPDGNVKVNNTGIKGNGEVKNAIGTGYVPDPNVPAKLLVKFSERAPAGTYWVIDTDYTTYSVVFSCTEGFGLVHFENAWLLSRDREGFPHNATEKIEHVLRDAGIEKGSFYPVDQLLSCGNGGEPKLNLIIN